MSELKGMVVFAVSEPLEDGRFFIKKSIRDGSLAIFDEEKDAESQLRRNDIKGNVVNELVVVRKEVVASVGSKLTALTEINRLQSEENKQLQQDKAELVEALKALVKVEHERGGTLGVSGSFNYPVPEGVFIKAKKLLEKHK